MGSSWSTRKAPWIAWAIHRQRASWPPKVQRECLKRGLILELGGRHGAVVRFLPPLIISAEQIDEVAERFAAALAVAVRSA